MKRTIIALTFVAILAVLLAFDGFIPASEMSGNYFKLSTYYQKTFSNFDDGFHELGMMVNVPVYNRFSIEADVTGLQDDVYKNYTFSVSPGYRVTSFLTAAVSAGIIYRDYSEDNLIFSEKEHLDDPSILVPTFGASLHGNFFDDRLNVGVGLFHLNRPDVSMANTDYEYKLPMKALAKVDWQVKKYLNLGAFYMHEGDEDYYGVSVGVSLPTPFFTTNVTSSAEKVSIAPEINTLNYWDVMFNYDYYYEDEINSTNYGVFVTYAPQSSETPSIIYTDNRWALGGYETLDEQERIDFHVEGQKRYDYVRAFVNGNPILIRNNVREYDGKHFVDNFDLNIGDNLITIEVAGALGEPVKDQINITRRIREIKVAALPDTIWNEDKVVLEWVSTIENPEFDIYLFENGAEKARLNAQPITQSVAQDGLDQTYEYTWDVMELMPDDEENQYEYQLRIVEKGNNIESVSSLFKGAVYEPEVVEVVEEPKPEPKPVRKPRPKPVVKEVVEEPVIVEPVIEPVDTVVVVPPAPAPEEPSMSWIWYVLIALAVIGVIVMFIIAAKRQKKKDEE